MPLKSSDLKHVDNVLGFFCVLLYTDVLVGNTCTQPGRLLYFNRNLSKKKKKEFYNTRAH